VISASGAYAGLTGEGNFTAMTDATTGELTAINKGEAHTR
jgi:hypothetical protein